MQKPLPFLISIPHGGTKIPEELKGRIRISRVDLFDDSDAYTPDIYDVGAVVQKVLIADIMRAFVDPGRSPDQMPPEDPDGLIKSCTCYSKPIYFEGQQPDDNLIKKLLQKYYDPYHDLLEVWANKSEIRMGFDCHSMADYAPPISPDYGQKRPLINLGNLDGKSCPNDIVDALAKSFRNVFKLGNDDVLINTPFKGGFITQKYGFKPKPWIQIEINRSLYLHPKWFNGKSLKINQNRLDELKKLFAKTLIHFYNIVYK